MAKKPGKDAADATATESGVTDYATLRRTVDEVNAQVSALLRAKQRQAQAKTLTKQARAALANEVRALEKTRNRAQKLGNALAKLPDIAVAPKRR
jgi:GTP1/Obg family GTP-binding protein